ncbi:hypothetical protein AXW84_06635 [Hymenobacter sp. PAMC 26628]|nr:hypothetical protein AXW84_06635 [Hymenobacter sp. PAMC 26628]
MPFGAVQPGPANRSEGWDWCSGHRHSDFTTGGFSHLHFSGTGPVVGNLSVVPTTGPVRVVKGTAKNPEKGYVSFSN